MALTVAQTADAGAPQAGITIDGLSATVGCSIVLTVSWDGGATWNPVRGGNVSGVLGSTFVRDYVTPLNVAATYQVVVTGGTTVTWQTASTITSAYGWLQDPLAPKSAIQFATSDASTAGALLLVAPSFGSISRKQPASYATPMGARLPVASVGQRQAPTGLALSFQGLAASQGALLTATRSLLTAAGQLVIRGLPAYAPIDPVAHVVAGDMSEVPVASGTMLGVFNVFHLVVNQVQPVSTRIVIPWWTYDQVTALVVSQVGTGATYAAVLAAQPTGKTYTAWLANPGVL